MDEALIVNKLELSSNSLKVTITHSGSNLASLEEVLINYDNIDVKLFGFKSNDMNLLTKAPIIYNHSDLLQDIKFLEHTRYKMEIDHGTCSDLIIMPKTTNYSQSPISGEIVNKDNFSFVFLNWKSNVGIDSISIYSNEDPIVILPVEIRAAKLSYFSDYKYMVDEIIAKSSNILWSDKSISSLPNKKETDISNNLLEDYFFIKAAMEKEYIPDFWNVILQNPKTALDREYRKVSIGNVSNFNNRTIMSIIQNPQNLVRANIGAARIPALRGMLPQEVEDNKQILTYDTSENRFLKFWLNYLLSILNEIIRISDENTLMFIDSKRMYSEIAQMLSHPMFHDVVLEPYIETGNLTLRRVQGYNGMFKLYQDFQAKGALEWDSLYEMLFNKQVKPVYDIYEIWVFIELINIIKSLSLSPPQIVFGKGKRFFEKISVPYHSYIIELNYQKVIKHVKGKKSLTSYSMRMDPDFLVNVFRNKQLLGSIAFDAKYKFKSLNDILVVGEEDDDLENEEEKEVRKAKRVDLLTMHAYKDAIRGVLGSYVVLPSQEKDIELWSENAQIVPSVGAFPLYPSNTVDSSLDVQRENIKNFIKKFINNLNRKST
ncbi:DUF2357 domain-containing protein [Neobacillus soli]|uniref:DUF2357 domain-containing protein n=1 Tax=Neobacillus soli TaxID=220688 RepID=UPI000824945A|nr:DUF2357 domain-containing protein [Neobacillus soli]